ncbi:GlxA family transcriptional regulator [Algirhabdus cladophorae]|uniref:GlxA family transcriptional regulator n=1 Tax=Algirhabdus cladophorae TaxID=3377108 RepID=UPI003B848E3D
MATISAPTTIGLLPISGFALMSYASVAEPLRAANLLAPEPLYEVQTLGSDPYVSSSGGALVPCTHGFEAALKCNLVCVIAGGSLNAFENATVLSLLRKLARNGVRLAGISGGPVVLAKAGVMQGRRMTVHWEHAAALSETHDDLLLERSLFVIDRDRITCAGGTAPLDLMHALIAADHGADLARRVSDWFMHTEVRPSGGPQRSGLVERVGTTTRAVLDAVEVMETHLADPLSLGQLASIAGVSTRQLNRLFEAKLGTTTMGYYRKLRLELAQRLLIQSKLSITEIAFATGFAGSAHFSKAYSTEFGHSPSMMKKTILP